MFPSVHYARQPVFGSDGGGLGGGTNRAHAADTRALGHTNVLTRVSWVSYTKVSEITLGAELSAAFAEGE